jgi:hypothetical protein
MDQMVLIFLKLISLHLLSNLQNLKNLQQNNKNNSMIKINLDSIQSLLKEEIENLIQIKL